MKAITHHLQKIVSGYTGRLGAIREGDFTSKPIPGKWSKKEILGHLIDAERIFTYRALRFARNDQTPLAGFEQDPYVATAHFDQRPWSGLVQDFEQVRRSTIPFFGALTPEETLRSGTASQHPITVRALGYIIAGHELHHMGVLRERYL